MRNYSKKTNKKVIRFRTPSSFIIKKSFKNIADKNRAPHKTRFSFKTC